MCPITMSHSSTRRRLFSAISSRLGREAGDQVGADRDLRPLRLQPRHRLDRVGPAVPALHPLQHHVVAGLEAHMEVRHEARLAGGELEQPVVHLDAVERGEAQARQLRDVAQDALDQLAEARRAGQVGPVAGDVDPGQHHLAEALVDQRLDPLDDQPGRHRAAVPAAIRDDAEGAAMVAAILHLDEGPRAFGEAGERGAARSRARP